MAKKDFSNLISKDLNDKVEANRHISNIGIQEYNIDFIPIEKIDTNPLNKPLSITKIDVLIDDILDRGLLQPLIVKQTSDGRYMLIAGERRLTALRKIHNDNELLFEKVHCVVRKYKTLEEEKEDMVYSNQHRENTPSDITWDITMRNEIYNAKKARGEELSISRLEFLKQGLNNISNTSLKRHLKISRKLSPDLQEKYYAGDLTFMVADHLSSLEESDQTLVAGILENKTAEEINVPVVDKIIKDVTQTKKKKNDEPKDESITLKYSELKNYFPLDTLSKKELKEKILKIISERSA